LLDTSLKTHDHLGYQDFAKNRKNYGNQPLPKKKKVSRLPTNQLFQTFKNWEPCALGMSF